MNSLPPGLYGIADAAFGDPVVIGEQLARAGCRTVQLRAKGWTPDVLTPAAVALQAVLSGLGCCFILNDHPEIAAVVGADGVHIGQGDGTIARARALVGPRALIGLSTHTLEQAQRCSGADYIGFGPIFGTSTKTDHGPTTGAELLAEVVRSSSLPVVAIGGIHLGNIAEIRSARPHGWAIISALLEATDLASAVEGLK